MVRGTRHLSVLGPRSARLVDLIFCRLRRGEGRRLAAEASSFSPPVVLEVSVERLDVALVLAEGVREIGVASPVAAGALGVRVLVLCVVRARAIELPLAPTLGYAFFVGCDRRELGCGRPDEGRRRGRVARVARPRYRRRVGRRRPDEGLRRGRVARIARPRYRRRVGRVLYYGRRNCEPQGYPYKDVSHLQLTMPRFARRSPYSASTATKPTHLGLRPTRRPHPRVTMFPPSARKAERPGKESATTSAPECPQGRASWKGKRGDMWIPY